MNDKQAQQLENLGTSLIDSDGKNSDIVKMLSEAILAQIMEGQALSRKSPKVKAKNTYALEDGYTIEQGDAISFDSRDYSDQYRKGDKPIWQGTLEASYQGIVNVQTNKGFIPKVLVHVTKDNGSKRKVKDSIQALNLESMVNLKVIK